MKDFMIRLTHSPSEVADVTNALSSITSLFVMLRAIFNKEFVYEPSGGAWRTGA